MYVRVSHFVIRMGTLLVLSVAALHLVATNTAIQQYNMTAQSSGSTSSGSAGQ
jgi:hypothetical protein